MTGIILAAGAGTRLNGSDVVRPKCLAPIGGTPLIERQLQALRDVGIADIVVVVGFAADRVRAACGPRVRFVENAAYARTNSLYSLWMARGVLERGFVVMNCDVLFHPQLLADLLSARHEDALLVSYPEPAHPPFTDEEMKVQVRRGQVVDIRKDLPPEATDGENVGIVKFSAGGAARLVPVMDRLISTGGLRDWAPRAFREFARLQPLYAIGTRGLPWTEIDTPADYQHATQTVFPAIAGALTAPAARGADRPLAALRRGA
jgi:L-glutamine-phosphate cytidylyltransferase